MNNILNVFIYELRRNITRKGFLFTTFGLPLIAMGIFFLVNQITGGTQGIQERFTELSLDAEGVRRAAYVDFADYFETPQDVPGATAQLIEVDDVATADEMLQKGEIDVYYIISADYMETGAVRLVAPRFSIGSITDIPVQQLLYGKLLNDGMSLDQLLLLANPITVKTTYLERPGESNGADPATNEGTVTLFAVILTLALFGTNGYLMQTIIEEKETRLIEILLSSVRPMQLLVGKIFALGLLGLLQIGVYIGALVLLSSLMNGTEITLPNVPFNLLWWAVVYFVLGYMLFAAFFGMIGAISTSMTDGPNLTIIFVLPAMLPWIFASEFAAEPNGGLAIGMSLFPITAPMAMVMRLSIINVPIVQIVASVLILSVTIIGVMWLAVRLFQVQTLLSGKMPKLREIPKLMFGH
ncbi:MAG: ABC transporter permease [Phototrophicales bacterium]